MAGSRKGEKRGAAGRLRRPRKPKSHETVGEIIDGALRPGRKPRHEVILRRIEIARIIHGPPTDPVDMTMSEIMAFGARFHMDEALGWRKIRDEYSNIIPATEDSTRIVLHAQRMIEHHLGQSTDHGYKAAPYLEPKLAAIMVRQGQNDSTRSIMDDLMDDLDALQRENQGVLIEHEPLKKIG